MKTMVSATGLGWFDARAEADASAYSLRPGAQGYLGHAANLSHAPACDLARLVIVAAGLLLLRSVVGVGRGIAITGRLAAGLFASSFDAAVSTAAARDTDGRPLGIWPPQPH